MLFQQRTKFIIRNSKSDFVGRERIALSGTIGSNNYQYGSTVYFWIEARDNANNLQWLNSSFQVIDIYPPTLTLVTTAPYTTLDNASVEKDLLVTVNAADNASGVQEVQLIFTASIHILGGIMSA